MSLDLLDAPVRLTWDLHGPAAVPDGATALAIADRIVAAGVFFVTLEERPLAHPAIAAVVRRLMDGGCRVQAACAASRAELAAAGEVAELLPAVQLDAAPFIAGGVLAGEPLRAALAELRGRGVESSLRLIPLSSNLHVIPELLSLCRAVGVQRFKLPNARIGDSFHGCPAGELPRWQDLEAFRALWTAAGISPGDLPALEIHDRFLWEIMTPGCEQAHSEYGGCQAANSLAHVDAAGTVYACAAWPEPLGSLRESPLDEIWQSPPRMAVRERVAAVPAGCRGCRDFFSCLGGCRGLGEILGHSGDGRDLMCRAPRE